MILESILKELIKIIINPLLDSFKKNYTLLNYLSQFKKLELKNGDFDSIYVHTLIEFSTQNNNSKIVEFFASSDIVNSYKKGIYLNNERFKIILDDNLHTLKILELKKYEFLDEFMPIVNNFTEIFESITIQSSSPLLLKIFNEQKKTFKTILEENYKKSVPYQISEYLKRIIFEYNSAFNKEELYIDIIGETRTERKTFNKKYGLLTLEEISELEKKEARPFFIKKKFDPIDIYVDDWLNSKSSNILVILGEYGTGKTTLCRHLFAKYGNLFLRNNFNYKIPFLFPLRNFEQNIDSFIINQLTRENISNLNNIEFSEMAAEGKLIIFFDGFDEMTQKIDSDEKKKNFQKLRIFAESNINSKIIITCRTEYFNSYEDIISTFKHRDSSIASIVYINPFTPRQISEFVKSHSSNPSLIESKIKEIYDLEDLAQRPVLLQLIVDYLPTILKNKEEKDVKIKSVDLYFTCITEELKRKDLNFILPNKYRLQILKNICLWLYHNNTLAFNIFTIGEELELMKYFNTKTPWEYEKYLNEFLTFTFLINDSKNIYRISHKSFRDYLVALELIQEINSGIANHIIKSKITDEIKNFIIELNPNKDNLLRFIYKSKEINKSQNWIGSNSASILLELKSKRLFKKDFSYCDLRNVDFSNVDISETIFNHANLSNCKLNSSILRCNYENANFNNAYLQFSMQNIEDLSFILNMCEINTLSIWNNHISDISPLYYLKNIKDIFIWSNPISNDDIETLKRNFPDCNIKF